MARFWRSTTLGIIVILMVTTASYVTTKAGSGGYERKVAPQVLKQIELTLAEKALKPHQH